MYIYIHIETKLYMYICIEYISNYYSKTQRVWIIKSFKKKLSTRKKFSSCALERHDYASNFLTIATTATNKRCVHFNTKSRPREPKSFVSERYNTAIIAHRLHSSFPWTAERMDGWLPRYTRAVNFFIKI